MCPYDQWPRGAAGWSRPLPGEDSTRQVGYYTLGSRLSRGAREGDLRGEAPQACSCDDRASRCNYRNSQGAFWVGNSDPKMLTGPKPYVYVTCISTGRRIEEPFARNSGPVAFVHRVRRRNNIRLIVTPDPENENHRVDQVPDWVSLEDALTKAIEAYHGDPRAYLERRCAA